MTPDLDRLSAIARTWLGTPFRADSCMRGRGVDCKFMVLQILDEWLGRTPVPPRHFIDVVSRYSENSIRMAFERFYGDAYELGGPPVRGGDVLGFKFGRLAHAALAIDEGHIIHVWKDGGVVISRLEEFAGSLVYVFHLKNPAGGNG